ncbi:MAG: aminotransferase class I/II-fold pyridoxal phosphate-dependent enzyme [Deltaproteobacteria bacterium]|nr:aminotransferase class I/II-fold pyridoxal phosphate-dependent enzyme [Deltaproteobacteria bacterium]
MASSFVVKPASRTEKITYAVRDVVVLAEKAAASGTEMLYLNIGDPNLFDFETPAHLVEAATAAMQKNLNGYAPSSGIKEARDAIAAEAARHGIGNVRDIFVTTGASEAIEVVLTALVDEGDNVLTPSPGYPLYTAVLAKLKVTENPYYLDENNGWQPSLEDIAAKINARTRAIVLINPNNPTGSVCDQKTLAGILALARAHELVVFADEIYDKLVFDGRRQISIASLDPEAAVVTFNGLSKAYLAPGFRIGWGIVSGDEHSLRPLIDAMNKILRARLSANHPLQYAVKPALEGDHGHLRAALAKLQHRRDLTVRALNAIPGVSCVAPAGAFYAFPRLEIRATDEEFVKALVLATGVVVVHGSGFGQMPETKHFRVVFLPPEKVLQRAFARLGDFLASYPGR